MFDRSDKSDRNRAARVSVYADPKRLVSHSEVLARQRIANR